MSVTCLLSNTVNDLRCPVCGQGFLVFAERATATVREQRRRSVQSAMRSHHAGANGALDVHTTAAFEVEDGDNNTVTWPGAWLPLENGLGAAA